MKVLEGILERINKDIPACQLSMLTRWYTLYKQLVEAQRTGSASSASLLQEMERIEGVTGTPLQTGPEEVPSVF